MESKKSEQIDDTLRLREDYFSLIEKFYSEIPDGLTSHRFKAWEYCYKYFHDNRKYLQSCEKLPNEALLIFSFYLASWGMYRGSSFLLSLDHTVHEAILKELLKNQNYSILMTDISELKTNNDQERFVSSLMQARSAIVAYYKPIRDKVCENQKSFDREIGRIVKHRNLPETEISDTLASKILLGIFGCIPAYDAFFKQGIKEVFQKGENGRYPISQNFRKGSVKKIIECYKQNKGLFDAHSCTLKIDSSSIPYPTMKKIDMLFWLEGYRKSKKKKNKSSEPPTTRQVALD